MLVSLFVHFQPSSVIITVIINLLADFPEIGREFAKCVFMLLYRESQPNVYFCLCISFFLKTVSDGCPHVGNYPMKCQGTQVPSRY